MAPMVLWSKPNKSKYGPYGSMVKPQQKQIWLLCLYGQNPTEANMAPMVLGSKTQQKQILPYGPMVKNPNGSKYGPDGSMVENPTKEIWPYGSMVENRY